MEGNLSEMLQGVLSDPSAMEKLMGVAQNLMGGQTAAPQAHSPTGDTAASSGSHLQISSGTPARQRLQFPEATVSQGF